MTPQSSSDPVPSMSCHSRVELGLVGSFTHESEQIERDPAIVGPPLKAWPLTIITGSGVSSDGDIQLVLFVGLVTQTCRVQSSRRGLHDGLLSKREDLVRDSRE